MRLEELGFWVAVGLVAIASVVLFKMAAAHPQIGGRLPALQQVAGAI